MLVKYNCRKCGREVEVNIKIPQFCSKECRIDSFREMVKARKQQNDNTRQTPAGENTIQSASEPAENTSGEQA